MSKVEEWVERSRGKIRADVAQEEPPATWRTAALREHADRGGLVAPASHDPGLAAAADLMIRLDEG